MTISKNKNKKLYVTLVMGVMGLMLLQGCGKKEDNTPKLPQTNQESTNSPDNDTENNKEESNNEQGSEIKEKELIEELIQMVGKTDEDAPETLGTAEIEKNDEGVIEAMSYMGVSLLNGTADVIIGFSEGKCLYTTFELQGHDYSTYLDTLTSMYGEAENNEDNLVEEGSDTKRESWNLNDGTVTLMESYGTIYLTVE